MRSSFISVMAVRKRKRADILMLVGTLSCGADGGSVHLCRGFVESRGVLTFTSLFVQQGRVWETLTVNWDWGRRVSIVLTVS